MIPPLLRGLFERRIPQVAAVYAGASWGFIQFVSFLEARYMLSPHWTDLSLAGLALLFPSVLLFTYNHGRPGRDEWRRSEKIAIPVNVILTVAVLGVIFSDKELGAMTTSVTVTDEVGRQVERTVPRSVFRKRFALFNFDAEPGDTAGVWLRYGMPAALEMDLTQDLFVDVRSFPFLRRQLRERGYGAGLDVPIALQREIAQQLHLEHFVNGRVGRTAGGFTLEVVLYETRRGRAVQRRVYGGRDILALVDQAAVQLKRDLGVPERHIEEVQDLPVATLLTSSLPAFRHFSDGLVAQLAEDDWDAAARHFEAAVALDPGFASAQVSLFQVYVNSDMPRAMAPLQSAMDHAYRLPERWRFSLRANYYLMRQEPERVLGAVQMWQELFPDDVWAHMMSASVHQQRHDHPAAIASLKRALELDPGQQELLRTIGSLYDAAGDREQALTHFRRYADAFPESAAVHVSIGSALARTGDHGGARASYERALLLEPSHVSARLGLARIAAQLGDFAEAERQYEEAVALARAPESRAQAHHARVHFHAERGELRRAVAELESYLDNLARSGSPLNATMERLSHLDLLVAAGRTDEARRYLAETQGAFSPPFDRAPAIGRVQVALERGDADAAALALVEMEEFIAATGAEAVRARALGARGRLHELRAEWPQALNSYTRQLELTPNDVRIRTALGRVHRRLGDLGAAEEQLRRVLDLAPADPHANHEAGLLFLERGDRRRGQEHLSRAQRAWTGADAEFALAAENRHRLAELDRLAATP